MHGNGRAAVFGVMVRMSIGTIPNHEWRPVFDLQGYISRCPLLYVPFWLRICPCSFYKCQLLAASENGSLPSEFGECASTLFRGRNSVPTASCLLSADHDDG